MTTTQTALMPIDPAVSPAQVSRLLPIRANLLPDEIRAGRNARRTRTGLIGAMVLVLAVMAGWYFAAVQALNTADENRATTAEQAQRARDTKKKYAAVVQVIADRDALTADLTSLLADDLPWARNTDLLRTSAKADDVVIQEMAGTMVEDTTPATTGATATAGATVATARPVATVTISGTAPDMKHIAAFLDRLARLDGFADPYLTSASKAEVEWTYAITAKITSDALCGRFTTACGETGGN